MLTAKPAKTVDDLMALPPETRAELIEGEIFMSPSPGSRHQTVVFRIAQALDAYAKRSHQGKVFVAPLDVILSRKQVFQPDVLFVSNERFHIVQERIQGAPNLVVEVISPGSGPADRLVKRRIYAKYAIQEYWIADPGSATVEILTLQNRKFALHSVFERGDRITSPLLKGFDVPLDPLFES